MNTITADRDAEADRALKAKHRAVWALGDYATVARELIPELGRAVVSAARIGPDDHVLDVAAGPGNAAIEAARLGAAVIASDLTPELLEAGRRDAKAQGIDLAFEQADAEALPYPDNTFDAVISCVGVMFAPHHARAASELVRVARPGGRLALVSWTPEGFIGQLFGAITPFMPAPPAGAQPAPLWGQEEHVRQLFADRVTALHMQRHLLTVDRFATAEEFRDFFRDLYGPTVAVYRSVAEDPARRAELDAALLALAELHLDGGSMDWEYLVATAELS